MKNDPCFLSLFLCHRSFGDDKLQTLLDNIAQTISNGDHIEILIKLDSNDENLESIEKIIHAKSDILRIKVLVLDQGKGYEDLHRGYSDLFLISNPHSRLYWVISDDVRFLKKGWDDLLLDQIKYIRHDLFVVHTLLYHPDLDKIDLQQALEDLDPFPIWSADWIKLIRGFGYSPFTDAWTSLLEYYLYKNHRLDLRIDCTETPIIERVVGPDDIAGSERYDVVRKNLHHVLQTEQTRNVISHLSNQIADKIADKIQDTTKNIPNKILSILVASDNIERLGAFLLMLRETCANPKNFEVIINVDKGNDALIKFIHHQMNILDLNLRIFEYENPIGYFGLNNAYDQMIQMIHKDSVFISILSTNTMFDTQNWDEILLERSDTFDHKIFYIRVSGHKYWRHQNLREAWDHCENWGFYSRKWLEVLGGWGDFWCPDATQEIIHYFLAKDYKTFVSVPEPRIQVSRRPSHLNGSGYMGDLKGLAGERYFYKKMLSYQGLKRFKMQALRLYIHCNFDHKKNKHLERKKKIKVSKKDEKVIIYHKRVRHLKRDYLINYFVRPRKRLQLLKQLTMIRMRVFLSPMKPFLTEDIKKTIKKRKILNQKLKAIRSEQK